MSEAVILKGVPVPIKERAPSKPRKSKYDSIANLSAGEMLFIPGAPPGIKQSAVKHAKKHGFKVTVAPHAHNGVEGMGIWRKHKES